MSITIPSIQLTSISKSFENEGVATDVLGEISLTIPQGGFVSLVGPSGCGKSTLLQIIARLKPGTDVEVKILRGNRTLSKHVVASQRPHGSLEKEAIIPSPAEEEGDFEERSR